MTAPTTHATLGRMAFPSRKETAMSLASRTIHRRWLPVVLLALVSVSLLAGLATPAAAAPGDHFGDGIGIYGLHSHGAAGCYTDTGGRNWIGVYNVRAYANATGSNRVAFQAYLFQWNGRGWVPRYNSGWQVQDVGIISPTPNPGVPANFSAYFGNLFDLRTGYWKVATRLVWYTPASTGTYMGETPMTWADVHAQGTGTGNSYCTFGGAATASAKAGRAGADHGRADVPPPPGESSAPKLPKGQRLAPRTPPADDAGSGTCGHRERGKHADRDRCDRGEGREAKAGAKR